MKGIGGLDRRGLAVAREVFGWREGFAERVNRPPRILLRDDLLAEIARRAPDEARRPAGATAGCRAARRKRILEAVQRAKALPPERLPELEARDNDPPHVVLLGEPARRGAGGLCSRNELAANLVASGSGPEGGRAEPRPTASRCRTCRSPAAGGRSRPAGTARRSRRATPAGSPSSTPRRADPAGSWSETGTGGDEEETVETTVRRSWQAARKSEEPSHLPTRPDGYTGCGSHAEHIVAGSSDEQHAEVPEPELPVPVRPVAGAGRGGADVPAVRDAVHPRPAGPRARPPRRGLPAAPAGPRARRCAPPRRRSAVERSSLPPPHGDRGARRTPPSARPPRRARSRCHPAPGSGGRCWPGSGWPSSSGSRADRAGPAAG